MRDPLARPPLICDPLPMPNRYPPPPPPTLENRHPPLTLVAQVHFMSERLVNRRTSCNSPPTTASRMRPRRRSASPCSQQEPSPGPAPTWNSWRKSRRSKLTICPAARKSNTICSMRFRRNRPAPAAPFFVLGIHGLFESLEDGQHCVAAPLNRDATIGLRGEKKRLASRSVWPHVPLEPDRISGGTRRARLDTISSAVSKSWSTLQKRWVGRFVG